jgi:hypothetical protein
MGPTSRIIIVAVQFSIPGEVIFLHIQQFGGEGGAGDVHQVLLELHIISTERSGERKGKWCVVEEGIR